MGRQRGIRRVGWAAKGNRESGLGGGGEQDGAAEANREREVAVATKEATDGDRCELGFFFSTTVGVWAAADRLGWTAAAIRTDHPLYV